MLTGYHLRFLKVDQAASSIEGADIVRIPPLDSGPSRFGVRLHARPTPPPPGDETVRRLVRGREESESEFVKRAFREAAAFTGDICVAPATAVSVPPST
jgi:hypothetical protein